MNSDSKIDLESKFKTLYKGELKNVDSVNDVLLVVIKLMQTMSEFNYLKGSDKKNLVTNVINDLLKESKLIKKSPEGVKFLIEQTLPPTIDFLVSASTGKWSFKKIKKSTKKLFCC